MEVRTVHKSTYPFPSLLQSSLTPFQQHHTPSLYKKLDPPPDESAYHSIEPLPNFILENVQPLKIRPFKPIYHMTMALESTSLSDLIAMDCTFPSRCSIRKSLIASERHEVLACNPRAAPAVLELYHWLISTYLPSRFATVYAKVEEGLKNIVTGDVMPSGLSEEDAEEALQLMGENIDDEFLLLLPSLAEEDEGKYRMEAFINCFPSGFNTRSKLDMLLADSKLPSSPHIRPFP
jgi:hypothetical protein